MVSKLVILIAGILIMASTSHSQEADAFLTKFFAVQVDESVFIRWTMSAGSTCSDTQIERSADGINYEKVGLIGGICGSPDEEMTFEFTDTLPLVNQTAYYRLLLGYFGYTSPKIVEFVRYNDKGYFLGPNPFSNYTRISFENDEEKEHLIVISDIQGRIMQELKTTGHEFIIFRTDIGSGTFHFRVYRTGQTRFSGSLVVF